MNIFTKMARQFTNDLKYGNDDEAKTKAEQKTKQKDMPEITPKVIPYFEVTEENIDKMVQKAKYKFQFPDTYETQVAALVDQMYNNIDLLKEDSYNFEYKKSANIPGNPSVWIANGDESYKFKVITPEGSLDLGMSRKQVARVKFLQQALKDYKKRKKIEALNTMMEIDEPTIFTIAAKHQLINISHKDIIESLEITHPQYFV